MHDGRRGGGQKATPELLDREHEHRVEIDVLEPGRRDVSQCFGRGAAPICRAPLIEGALDFGGVPSHHDVGQERKRARLGDQLCLAAAAARPESGAPDLARQYVSVRSMIERKRRTAALYILAVVTLSRSFWQCSWSRTMQGSNDDFGRGMVGLLRG